MSTIEKKSEFLRTRRPYHFPIAIDSETIFIRDQRPISEKALSKCLTDGWNCGDYIYQLNEFVFLWPTTSRLERHYNRYRDENPCIIRFESREFCGMNKDIKFSRLNSGATRPNYHLGGIPAFRGPNTFRSAEDFHHPVSSVAEVVISGVCKLPNRLFISGSPDGPWKLMELP